MTTKIFAFLGADFVGHGLRGFAGTLPAQLVRLAQLFTESLDEVSEKAAHSWRHVTQRFAGGGCGGVFYREGA